MKNNYIKNNLPKEVSIYDTDLQWQNIGSNDPYFGVLSAPKFKKINLNDSSLEEFFSSGEDFVDRLFNIIRQKIDNSFKPDKSIEFGCGVGRLLLPLSKLSNKVVGVDISDSMLEEAKNNFQSRNIENYSLFKSDDALSQVNEKFNFALSFIVFQHIPPERGSEIFRKLLNKLEDGGIGVFHFVYHPKAPRPTSTTNNNQIRMEMNAYDLNSLTVIIQNNGCNIEHTMFTNHMGYLGVTFFLKKGKVNLL